MAINLGYVRQELTVNLTPGSTFTAGLRSSAGAWPVGTAISLVLAGGTITWPATISDDLAQWTVNTTDVQAVTDLAAAAEVDVQLRYTDGVNPVEWASGKVRLIP